MSATPRSAVWHPFAQHALIDRFPRIASARGAWLETAEGDRMLDAIASWWVITHGHCHPAIVAAVKRQAESLDQIIFANFTHEPAEHLAHALVDLAPAGLNRVFYSDSGSTAVEVALKMALGYWHNRGAPRSRILALEHAYHGDTVGTMSPGARGVFTAAYAPLLFDVGRLPFPDKRDGAATLEALEAACQAEPVAALIVEPLILGAGGMLTWPAQVLTEMRAICDRYGVLLIADEVMTGWGRSGTLFACEQAGIAPDILCTAKGITGGLMPLAATLCTDAIFEAHYDRDRTRTFFHSSSYTANPLACAAAVANIGIWTTRPVIERLAAIADWQAEEMDTLRAQAGFINPRTCGTIAAVDVAVPDNGYLSAIGPPLQRFAMRNGVMLRPLGNTVYVMPPYCITREELGHIYSVIAAGVKRLKAEGAR